MPSFRMFVSAAAFAAAVAVPAFAHSYDVGQLHIGHPWTRATPPKASVAGGYMTIENRGKTADTLLGGSAAIARDVQVHSMSMDGGVMKMRRLPDGLEIPAGKTVTLAPSGYHLMLIDPKRPLKKGERIPVTLTFRKAGEVKVELAVESLGATGPDEAGHHHGAKAGVSSGKTMGGMDMSGGAAGSGGSGAAEAGAK